MSSKKVEPEVFDPATATLDALTAKQAEVAEAYSKAREAHTKEALLAMSADDRAAAIASLKELTEQYAEIKAELDGRKQAAADAEAELGNLDALMAPPEPEPASEIDQEPEADAEPEADVTDITPKPKVPTADKVAEPLAAAATPAPKSVRAPSINQVVAPKHMAPLDTPAPRMSIVASSAPELGIALGSPLDDKQLGEVMAAQFDSYRQVTGVQRRSLVASVDRGYSYPAERILRSNDSAETVLRKIRDVIGGANTLETLTAAVCAPSTPVYTQDQLATRGRPLLGVLPSLGVDQRRGSYITVPPSSFADASAAITHITGLESTPDPATKAVLDVTCGSPVTTIVEAFALRIRDTNFNRMTFAERWTKTWEDALAMLDRIAESVLLSLIRNSAFTLQYTGFGADLGIYRDLLNRWSLMATAIRSSERMDETAPLTLVAPSAVRRMMVEDLRKQQPGDNTLTPSMAQVDQAVAALNLNVGWYRDTPTGGSPAAENQIYSMPDDGAAGPQWINTVEWGMWPPAAWAHAELPIIDLGTEIRDSANIPTNQVEGFLEGWETVVPSGLVSVWVSEPICVSGASSAAVDNGCGS
jgi:hypothetical protein